MGPDHFSEVETEYLRLRGQLSVGRITREQFLASAQQLRTQDVHGRYWAIQADTGHWMVFDGQRWVESLPPDKVSPPASVPLAPPGKDSVYSPVTRPQSTRRASSLRGKWFAAGLAVLVVLLVFSIGMFLAVNSGVMRIALGETQTPMLVSNPVAALVTPPTTNTYPPTASSSPTPSLTTLPTSTATPLPTGTATSTPTIPATPTQTSTATRTVINVPTVLPTAASVTFKFDGGVSAEERSFIQNAIAIAQSRLGNPGPVTILAFANFDDLAAEADRQYNRTATSVNSKTFREMFSSGSWIANGGSGVISVWISSNWLKKSSAFKLKTITHEYYHNLQSAMAKKDVQATGPIWLYEGATELAAYEVAAQSGAFTLDQVRVDKISQSRGLQSPLSSMITLANTQLEDTEYPYSLGYLASEYLLAPFESKRLSVLRSFYEAQTKGATWQDAFKSTFGLTVEEFYPKFEAYRASNFPALCGPVASPGLAPTPDTLSIRLVRKLAPGEALRLDMPWSDPPNMPYVFCIDGKRIAGSSGYSFKFPSGYAGWISCGANCVTVFMYKNAPAGVYTFGLKLTDGRQAETTFEVKP